MSKRSLQSIQSEIKDETSKSVESLQRSLRLLAETEDIGTYVLEELQVQGEKMDRIDQNLTTIEQKQQESGKLLIYLSGIWSRMTTSFQDPLLIRQLQNTNQRAITQSTVTYAPVVQVPQQNKNMVWTSPTSMLPTSATHEQDKDYINSELLLQQLNRALSGLTDKANHIHETLIAQNEKLDIMNSRVDIANANTIRLNKKINTITS